MIQKATDLLTGEIGKLRSLRILRVVDTKTKLTDSPLDVKVKIVDTNESAIAEIQNLILDGRSKILGMKQVSIPQILEYVEELESQVNQIDYKQVERVEMSETQYKDARELREGGETPAPGH